MLIELSSFKLIQFLKNYVNSQEIKTPIAIRSRIAQIWLYKLDYVYENVRKNIFVDEYEQLDVIEDHANFLRKMEELKPYIVEFD